MGDKKKKSESINSVLKQEFLSSAISDISSYITLADTKVSIIMATIVAFLVGVLSLDTDTLVGMVGLIKPCSWLGGLFSFSVVVGIMSILIVFGFGILTIRSHSSKIAYSSKWIIIKGVEEYSFDRYKADVMAMSDKDIIENMAAELYKLNDINRQKQKTYKVALKAFSVLLVSMVFIIGLIMLANIQG